MARPSHQRTEDLAERISTLVGYGIDHDTIAKLCGISDETMRKYYRDELDTGKAALVEKIAGSLKKSALAGDVQAQKFFLSSRAGWAEKTQTEHSGTLNVKKIVLSGPDGV